MSARELLSIPGFADPVSSLSHLLGAVVFAALAIPLLRRGVSVQRAADGRTWSARTGSLMLFAFSAVFLLSMSGVFHLLHPHGPARAILQRLDHAAIFILIAGTSTPIHAILFRGAWRWGMLAILWTIAILGVTLKSIYFRSVPEAIGIALYLGMGWFGIFAMTALARRRRVRLIIPLVLGGLAYTVGAIIEWANPRPLVAAVLRAHEIFHAAVLIGLALHWRFVWIIAGMTDEEALWSGNPKHNSKSEPRSASEPGASHIADAG